MIRKIAALGLGAVGAAALAGPVSAAETILCNSFVPPKHIINTGIVHPWHDEIGRVTEGRVKVKRPAKNMAAPPRQFDLVTQGTAGKAIDAVAGLPAVSVTVTVASAVLASAVSGVPLITPVEVSMSSPGGRPVAP